MVKDRSKPESHSTSRLSLRHTYISKSLVDFAGPSNFGGKDDQLVLCAGKGPLTSFPRLPSLIANYTYVLQRETFTYGTANQGHDCIMSVHSLLVAAT